MSQFIDLSHVFKEGMPGFKLKNEDGTFTQYSAKIHPFMTHEESKPKYGGKCSFEITEMSFQTSIGTYLDSPFHRYPSGRDISQIQIEEVILPGIVIDARGRQSLESVGTDVLPQDIAFQGKAVLFNFGWDAHWEKDEYQSYPYISRELIDALIDSGVRLVGVDTVNIDDARDLSRPAHTRFLAKEIFVVENLANLDQLHGKKFRFFAVPLKGKRVAAMPIRAFAEIMAG